MPTSSAQPAFDIPTPLIGIIQSICERRPDLLAQDVADQINSYAEFSRSSPIAAAAHCRDLVLHGAKMPWELWHPRSV